MSVLSAKGRKSLPSSDFAVPSKAPGSGSYPIPDAGHARAALGRINDAPPSERPAIRAKADAMLGDRRPGMETAMNAHADQMHPVKGRK